MLTNKITGFSADLLNTVRGILGEAKKCPADCECEKCEAEEDDMEEGYMPTADEPTDANKKTADKVRAMMAKEKKPVKEEAKEDLPFEGPYRKTGDRKDEYGNKVKNVAKYLAKKAMKANEEVEDIEEKRGLWDNIHAKRKRIKAGSGEKMRKPGSEGAPTAADLKASQTEELEHTNCGTPECCGQCDTVEQIDEATAKIVAHLQKRYGDNIRKSHVRSAASDFGVDASKLAKAVRTKLGKTSLAEDEQIDEVSKATLGRYINKAKDSIDTASYRQGHKEAHGSSSKPLEKKLTKRHKGISTAVNKLTKEDAEQIEEAVHRFGSEKSKFDSGHRAKLMNPDGKLSYLSQKSYKTAEHAKEAAKFYHSVAHLPMRAIDNRMSQYNKDYDAKHKMTEDAEQIDELSKGTMGRYINKAATKMGSQGVTAGLKIAADEKSSKNFKDMGKREKGIKLAVNKLTKEEQDFVDALNADIEQIDELSKDAMLKYLSANKKDDTKARETGDYDKMTKRMRGTDMAVRKYTAKPGSKYVRVPATEEVELDEGEEKGGGYDGMPKGLQDRAPRGRARNAMGRAIAKKERNLTRARMDRAAEMKKEEVEQIDEISKGTAMKALQHASSDPDDVRGYTLQNKIGKKWPEMKGHAADASYTAGYGRSGRNIFQDRDNLADRAKTSYRMTKDGKANKQDLKARFRKEEVELDEARGRPRKAGAKDFTIHPKTKEKLMHNNPADMKRIERLQKNGVLEKPKVEAGQHIMNQLQKAKTSMLGGSKINFTHGDSKEVSGPHAAKILTKYAGMKPNEKEDFQKFVGHSHENLMKHV